MSVLLDTCALLWLAQDRTQFSAAALARLASSDVEPAVSAISAFEIAVKWRKGRLTLPLDPESWFLRVTRQYQLRVEPVTAEDALRSALLPVHHNDPCDRIIVATAARLNAVILTPDPMIRLYSDAVTLW